MIDKNIIEPFSGQEKETYAPPVMHPPLPSCGGGWLGGLQKMFEVELLYQGNPE